MDLDGLWSSDRARQNTAYEQVMAATAEPVPWAGDVWDDVVAHLAGTDNHDRAIAAQLLGNLAAHDTGGRIERDLPALMAVTRDERFVTARHALKSVWRAGLSGDKARATVVGALAARYREAEGEKNGTLVRHDIVESLRHLRDATQDDAIEAVARELIALEPDPKYRKKYARHWPVSRG
ncbi:hypothetical protein [Actinoplanes sp. NPDC089786]|uniref:hypothetical protein n=1 Tax=Actinoplanes sp. NPDC089786 TaxID=3155185 RepID=UPI0034474F3D